MQHNPQKKNTSQLLRNTAESKRKSRHRLLGSIFLLVIALVVLLNVTSKVKPVDVNPRTIEIQDTTKAKTIVKKEESDTIAKQISSQPVPATSINSVATNNTPALNKSNSSASQMEASSTQSEHAIDNRNEPTNNNNGYKASIVDNNKTPTDSEQSKNMLGNDTTQNKHENLALSPKVVTEKASRKLTPEQILNGETEHTNASNYFIQLMATTNKDKLIEIKQQLSSRGIRSFIQEAHTSNGKTIYRLRMGPFKTEDEAHSKLSLLDN
ncbi:MAG: SPOR domain-containing protein [Neisseriaceae bacterium]|jgi:cell division septation protein DedD